MAMAHPRAPLPLGLCTILARLKDVETMARDFRPKDKNKVSRPHKGASAAPAPTRTPSARASATPAAFSQASATKSSPRPASGFDKAESDIDEDEEGNEDDLREAIAALGGEQGDLDLISAKALKGKGKGKQRAEDEADDPNLGNELRAFMKGLKFDIQAPSQVKSERSAKAAREVPTLTQDPSIIEEKAKSASASNDQEQKPKKDRRPEKIGQTDGERAAARAKKEREDKLDAIASKASRAAEVQSLPTSSTVRKGGHLLLDPLPDWMNVALEPLPAASPYSNHGILLPHDRLLSLLSQGAALLDTDNKAYHTLLNSGSSAKMTSLGGLTPSDAKLIASLLGNTTSSSNSTAVGGGTLSDRIAAHALLLGSSPHHNLRSLDALVSMASKKSREESGRATRALADWFAGAGLGKGRKLRYLRDQPHLATTAEAPEGTARDQRLALYAYEDRLKKTYFAFLQALETQSHDTLAFVRQQAVTQIYLLLREKSEQEQNLLRLLVNKLGDGERSVASKATNSLLELLNTHPAMKSIVAREIGELIRKPTRSTGRADNETTKKHHSHAKYYGVLALNQIVLTRQDAAVATPLVHLYFELFEDGLGRLSQAVEGDQVGEAAPSAALSGKKNKNRWRDNKSKSQGKGKGKMSTTTSTETSRVQDADSKMMAAILTGVRRAFPFADLDFGAFDKHLSTLFRITHSASFNIAVQALQLIHVIATSSTSSSQHILDRFHSTLYSSMLDPRLASTSKSAMYLNLCFKAIREDIDESRRAAEVKRLLQILGQMDVEFVCGALFLVAELLRAQPRLRRLLTDPEDDDEVAVANPPDEEEVGPQASNLTETQNGPGLVGPASHRYDPFKRDPRYANAQDTCLWDLVPLLGHFHPTVKLLAHQLLTNEALTTAPDLSLYSLSHFLDRFVYRNPKKRSTLQKGASGMQPAIAAGGGIEGGIRRIKGWGGTGEEVNTPRFWKQNVQDVAVDSLFFHKYFNLREARPSEGGAKGTKMRGDQDVESEDEEASEASYVGSDVSLASDEVDEALRDGRAEGDSGSEADSSDLREGEIWSAMKRTMPKEVGDESLFAASDGDDEDDEDLAVYDYTESEEDTGQDEDGDDEVDGVAGRDQDDDSDDEEASMFEEDEDDLLPFADFGSEASDDSDDADTRIVTPAPGKSKKRDRLESADQESNQPKSKSQLARHERKKRKATSAFASAEDYAALITQGEADEGEV
ncbi:CBF-domain-containing protein [Microstroma glucosiphilum]|uniref:CBF-domain-containing protein n=1 Tax=Pseudomicrostroma glucosiphilum TaxID=1684307 RepID=A0A316U759_9BASI|nr:CBF-domain-containing protein [Pseudomicrostroma glucosiphilum]PWN21096.1 CBF-domain-containing protein [Pseudomicrostroma glucosiphilum]